MPEIERRLRRHCRPGALSRSWRVDETDIKVKGKWAYLYRAVNGRGDTIDFHLSQTRNANTARRFLGKAQARPVRAPDREVAPEIEKGTLADPVPLAAVLDQAKGDVVAAVAGGACLGLSNEHGSAMADGAFRRKASPEQHGTTDDF